MTTGRTPYDAKIARSEIFRKYSLEFPVSVGFEIDREPSRKYTFRWLKRFSRYIPDQKGEDLWQTPLETSARGGGDCEDLSVFLADRFLFIGGDPKIVVGRVSSQPGKRHVWVELDGVIYDVAKENHPIKAPYHKTRYVPAWAFNEKEKYIWMTDRSRV